MPPRFSAPIPVWNAFGRPRRVYETDVRRFMQDAYDQAPNQPRRDAIYSVLSQDEWPLDAYLECRRNLIAWGLARSIQDIVHFTERVASQSRDALTVDDKFMLYLNPQLNAEVGRILLALDEMKTITSKGQRKTAAEQLQHHIVDWMEESVRRLYPEVNKASMAAAIVEEENPICWHAQPHEEMVRRGRGHSPRRRAATFGTYTVAWLVGSETLAVNLWNKVVGSEHQWGKPDKPAYALAKYWDAKRRLIADLSAIGGQKLIPQRSPLRPGEPLEPNIAEKLTVLSQALLGKVEMTAALETLQGMLAKAPREPTEKESWYQ